MSLNVHFENSKEDIPKVGLPIKTQQKSKKDPDEVECILLGESLDDGTYLNIQYSPQTSRVTLVQHPSKHHTQQNLLRDEINSDPQAETISPCDETRVDGRDPFYRTLSYTWVEG